jgi:pSer/pThr/pTyr-binding forkhead associated (FHA) protein
MVTQTRTHSYPQRFAWALDDAVIRLRQWGTDTVYELPSVRRRPSSDWTVGSGSGCAIHLEDRWTSRRHAQLSYEHGRWTVTDLESRNGLKIDGVSVRAGSLQPGMELRIGRTTLVAESMRSVELHCFLGRLLGWSKNRREAVDAAMHQLRWAPMHKEPIVLRGPGDLVPVAHDLHLNVFGIAAPFIVCDPTRQTGNASARAPANIQDGDEALAAAKGGSLCIRNDKPPESLPNLLDKARQLESSAGIQVIVCDDGSRKLRVDGAKPLDIPPLAKRSAAERAHVVTEYAADAARDLGARRTLTGDDQDWVLRHCGASLAEIGRGTRRLLALRMEGSLADAARLLDMSYPALRRWFADRGLAGLPATDVVPIAAERLELDA